jgi:Haem-NO-binding
MYGMIHRGIRQMVREQVSSAAWDEIESALSVGPSQMIGLATYDDSLTIAILTEVAKKMGLDFDELLQQFGRYWIRFADGSSFSHLMNFIGTDLASFLKGLNNLHQAVQVSMPDARLPLFYVLDERAGYVKISYRSERLGLRPFVLGLLEGVLARFDIQGKVELVDSRGGADIFVVSYG